MFGDRTPGQALTGPSWLRGDEMPAAQSQRAGRLSKSSEINGAWQIGASGSDKNERQDGGLSEVMLDYDATPGKSKRNESRKRIAEDSENDARLKRHLAWLNHSGEVIDVGKIFD